jgi:hypothetical protein
MSALFTRFASKSGFFLTPGQQPRILSESINIAHFNLHNRELLFQQGIPYEECSALMIMIFISCGVETAVYSVPTSYKFHTLARTKTTLAISIVY